MIENKKYIEFGKKAKEVVTQFSWNKIIEKYKQILES